MNVCMYLCIIHFVIDMESIGGHLVCDFEQQSSIFK